MSTENPPTTGSCLRWDEYETTSTRKAFNTMLAPPAEGLSFPTKPAD